MFAALRNHNFALLWTGQFVSLIGDYTLAVALAFYVLQLTGSILQTGLMFIIEAVPSILLGTLAGVFVDRWDRRKTMIVSNLLQAGVISLLLLVHSPALIWLVYIVALLQSIISLFFSPALRAITPVLVDEKQLSMANSLESFNDSVTRLVGPLLGGALLTLSGLNDVVFVDATSFLFAVLTLCLIVMPRQQIQGNQVQKESKNSSLATWKRTIWREWLKGLRAVRKSQVLSGLFVVAGITMLGQGFINVMFVVYVKMVLHGNGLIFSLMPMAQGVGALFGSFLIARAHQTIRPGPLMAFCLVVIGAATFVFLSIPALPLVLLMIALIGFLVVGSYVTKQTLVQLNTLDSYRGRVFGALGTSDWLTVLVGMLLATLLGDRLGPVFFLGCSAILYILAGLAALVLLRHATMAAVPLVKSRNDQGNKSTL